jgi:uncharacterized membrane protein
MRQKPRSTRLLLQPLPENSTFARLAGIVRGDDALDPTGALYASTYAPMAGVAALRQTSVVIASLFGTALLGERPWRPRVAAAFIIALGSALVAVRRIG